MKIWLIKTGEQIPSDPGTPRLLRTGILAKQLAERGHEVTWWNATLNHQQKIQRSDKTLIEDVEQGYQLILLHGRLYKTNISVKRIISQIENARAFRQLAPMQPRPDIIVCSYPTIELAKAATDFAQQHNIPIVVDFRDLWPEIIEKHVPGKLKIVTKPLFCYWQLTLRHIVNGASGITGITEPIVDWALEQGGRTRAPLDRAFHLAVDPHPPDQKAMQQAEEMWDDIGVANDPECIIGCYAGVFSKRNDVETVLKAAITLPDDEKQKIKLVLCGRGELEEEFRRLAKGQPHIIIPGWRSAAEINVLLQRSSFGLLPYLSTLDFRLSFPNKVGEYLSAGMPIMTGVQGLTNDLLQERELGFFYKETNAASARQCLQKIIQSSDVIKDMRPVAIDTFHQLFDGDKIYPAFGDYLEFVVEAYLNRQR